MFARTAFRTIQAAAPLRQPISRRYASGSPSSGGTGSVLVVGTAALAAGGGAYYFFGGGGGNAAAVAHKAEAKVKEAADKAKAAVSGSGSGSGGPKVAFTGGDQGFVPLELDTVEAVNHNTKRLRFKLPEEDSVSGMVPATALLTKFTPEGADKPVVRPYTAISDDDAQGYLELLVKRYEGGLMSSHITGLVPGQKLDFKGPIVKYPWTANKHEHIALVAGGTGITPMYQLLRAIFKNPAAGDQTKVTLVFGNIAEEDILLRQQLAELENTYPQRFRAFYVLEKPPSDKWTGGTKGYITKELLKQVLPEPASGNIKVFVCGPPPMMKAISGPKKSPSDQGELSGILKELGYTQEQVLKF